MKRSLRTQLSLGFATIILITVALISLVSNFLITREFENYMANQQKKNSFEIANSVSMQYDGETGWNVDYIHGLGMYALNDGYIVKVYDQNNAVVWDAESHDMEYCHQMMQGILERMEQLKSEKKGQFITQSYELQHDGTEIGWAEITYYSPYYFDENAFDFVRSLNLILLVIGSIALIGAVCAGTVLASRIIKPIVQAKKTADRIAEGDYSSRADGTAKTQELKELNTSINNMAEQIERQEALRKQLTSDVAHELRTPLTNISTQLEVVLEGIFDPTEERLQGIYEEIQRLSVLVSELEKLQQIENNVIERTEFDLLDLTRDTARAFEVEINKKGLSLNVLGESVQVFADERKMRQVISNLLSNAIKYSFENGKIDIAVKRCGDNAVLSVKDDGIGISEEDKQLIFERFYRSDKSRNRKTGGVGIGLTIANAIVKAHGGTITVKSEEGKGSIFTVIFPADSRKTF